MKKLLSYLKLISTSAFAFFGIPEIPGGTTSPPPSSTPDPTVPQVNNILNTLPSSKFNTVDGLILGIANWILMLASVLAVVALIYSGIMYITAGGDTAKADTAKKNITWAIIGLVVIMLALIIIRWINNIVNAP